MMKLGTQVGLGPGHIALRGDPAPLPQRGTTPPNFRSISVAAKWLHGSRCDMVWSLEVGLGPGDFVLHGDPAPLPKKGAEPPPQFSPHFFCGQTAGCMKMPLGTEVGPQPWGLCVRWGPSPPPIFSAHVYYSYYDFVRTLHSRYWFVQVQVLVLYAFYF